MDLLYLNLQPGLETAQDSAKFHSIFLIRGHDNIFVKGTHYWNAIHVFLLHYVQTIPCILSFQFVELIATAT
jgi:hypothetical protein